MSYSRRQMFWMAAAAGFLPGRRLGATEAPKSGMIVRSTRPQDLEMPLEGFKTVLTPVEKFYVRTHTYAPNVDLAAWSLKVGGDLVSTPLTLTMADLKQMPRVELISVCECAGNGRGLYEPSVPGLQWTYGAVGSAKWAGVRMADVLKKAGIKAQAKDLLFDGADVPVGTQPDFQRTIPVGKAMQPEVLLAYEMNGEPLAMQHGFPLRVVVPGWAGDCWVKWLTSITPIDKEFEGFFMKTAYRHPGKPIAPGSPVPADQMKPVTTLRIKSVIATPLDRSKAIVGEPINIAGAAWSGDSGPVTGVDVSVDGGRTWKPATLGREQSRYGFRLFRYTWTPPTEGYVNVMARARDAKGETQPLVQEWNPSGYLYNVVHTVGVDVVAVLPDAAPATNAQPAASAEAPAGFKNTCLVCHQEDVMEQQRLTRGQWERELGKMTSWGAKLKPEEKDGILDYLSRQYGPRPRK